jgi:type I restriction enzyme, S subunit
MGIPWLEEYSGATIPIKRSYELLLGKMVQPSAATENDVEIEYLNSASVQWHGIDTDPAKTMWASPKEIHSLSVALGDLLICEGGDAGRSAIYNGLPGRIFQNSVHRARGYQDTDVRYLRYLLMALHHSGWLDVVCNRSTIAHLTVERLGAIEIPQCPADEQRRIADFLDAEMARVNAIMASRSIQISLLEEIELTRIGEHLSGADHTVDRRATPWHWLPSTPSQWTIGPVYAYFDVQLGKMLNADRSSGGSQGPYLRNANIHWYEIGTEDLATMTFEPDERRRYSVHEGDLLVCEGGAGVAEAAVWDGRLSPCFYQKSLHRVRARHQVPVEWLMYWLRFAKAVGVFNADGNVATIPHLTGEQLAEYRIPIPPDGSARVAELNSEIAAIRRAQKEMSSANALLAERRQALITAAVTGQIDVTTARGGAA